MPEPIGSPRLISTDRRSVPGTSANRSHSEPISVHPARNRSHLRIATDRSQARIGSCCCARDRFSCACDRFSHRFTAPPLAAPPLRARIRLHATTNQLSHRFGCAAQTDGCFTLERRHPQRHRSVLASVFITHRGDVPQTASAAHCTRRTRRGARAVPQVTRHTSSRDVRGMRWGRACHPTVNGVWLRFRSVGPQLSQAGRAGGATRRSAPHRSSKQRP